MVKEITDEIVQYVDEHLDEDRIKINLRVIYEKYGSVSHEYETINSVNGSKIRSHSHFFEGMEIRRLMRECSYCNKWSGQDLMETWPIVAEILINVREV